MSRNLNPYYLTLFASAVVLMVFFKINKHSFYHHYFKTIEEVETRNSQEMPFKAVAFLAPIGQRLLQIADQLFSSLFSLASLLMLLPVFFLLPFFSQHIRGSLVSKLYVRFAPINAP